MRNIKITHNDTVTVKGDKVLLLSKSAPRFGVQLSLCLSLCFITPSTWAWQTILNQQDRFTPEQSQGAMVVAAEPLAAQAGLTSLKAGGNAIDAAVVTGFVMAVTYPRAGNIGGGGFMLLKKGQDAAVHAIDYREKAPAKAHKDIFLDAKGHVDKHRSRFSHQAAGVPGTVAGLALALERFGTWSLAQALAPAIKLAEQGFIVSPSLADSLQQRQQNLKKHPASADIFYHADGSPYQAGERLIQSDLAHSLKLIAKQGTSAFYQGDIAKKIVAEMQANQGLISLSDLQAYRAKIRQPIQGQYRGYEIFSMSPPSSGGVHIVQMLNILERLELKSLGHNSAESLHWLIGAMQLAYADRATYLGDSDFVDVPLQGLSAKAYAKHLFAQIDPEQARLAREIKAGNAPVYESPETTHFVIIDKAGNVVSNTYTLNFSFGSGITVSGAGFLLNNQMDDFSAKVGVANAYGLIGGSANAIAPHKKMLSSMSPTIVSKDGKPLLILGSPGGSRIITTVLQVLLNVLDHDMNIQTAVNAPRIHQQWLPDKVFVEQGISPDTLDLLTVRGHHISQSRAMGAVAAIYIDPDTGLRQGAADPRQPWMQIFSD